MRSARRSAQDAGRDSLRDGAAQCDEQSARLAFVESLNLLEVENFCNSVRDGAVTRENSGAGIRTPDTRIMIPLL